MNKKNKYLKFAFALFIMIFSGVTVSFANESNYEQDINLLNSLSVTDIDLESFNADEVVTRTVFADAVASMMKSELDNYTGNAVGDLSARDKGIMYLSSNGIMGGYGNDEFLPQKNISLQEATTVLLSAMGYSAKAQVMGGFPSGYMALANDVDMLDGVKANAEGYLTYGSFVKLIANSLDVEIMVLKSVAGLSSDEAIVSYELKEGTTLLSEYRDIYKNKGVVTANEITGLYSARENTGMGKVVINSQIYEDLNEVACELLGCEIEFYYEDNEKSGLNLLWAHSKKTTYLTIRHSDIISFTDNTYSYSVGNSRTKKEKIPQDIKVFYNGVFAESTDRFVPHSGDITLVDTDNNGAWDMLKIREPKFVVVHSVENEEIIYDRFDENYNILLGSGGYNDYKIIDSQGGRLEISDIIAGNILEVEQSQTNQYCKITIINNQETSTLKSIDSNHLGIEYLNFDEKTYEASYRFNELILKGDMKQPIINALYQIYLNSFGEIVFMENNSEEKYRNGYIKKIFADTMSVEDSVYVDLIDNTGIHERYMLAERVKLGDKRYKLPEVISDVNFDEYKESACSYVIDINGKISEIYIPDDGTDKIKKVYSKADAYLYNYLLGYTFGTQTDKMDREPACSISSSAKVFVVPDNTSEKKDDRYYSVVRADELKRYVKYNVSLYNTSDEIGWGDFAVIRSNIPYMKIQGVRPVLINKVRTYYDEEEGEVLIKIDGIQNGNEISVQVVDSRTDKSDFPLDSGDIAYLLVEADGKVRLTDKNKETSIDVLFDYKKDGNHAVVSKNGKVNDLAPTYYRNVNGSARLTYGAIYKAEGSKLWVNPSDDIYSEDLVEAFDCSSTNARIYKYNENTKMFEKVSIMSAVGYQNDTINYNKAFVFAADAGFGMVIIY